MRLSRLAPAIVLLGALGGPSVLPPPVLVAGGVTRQEPVPGAPVGLLAGSIADLGYRMRTLDDGGNWVASPLSVATAFAMVRAGARGSTRTAIDRTFGFPADVDSAFNSITRQVAVPPEVRIANGLFVQRGLPVGRPFLGTLAAQYGAGVHPVDFGSGDAARVINQWVRQQTAGKIKKMYRPDPADVLVLANAVYLKARWDHPFERVADELFHSPDGDRQVPTMTLIAELPYASGAGWTSVDLPYRDTDLVMRVLLPAPGGDPADLLRSGALTAPAHPRRLELHLPKWSFSSMADLTGLGPAELFGAGADLSGIIPGGYVSSAQHQAFIAVDEDGTEAAAASTLIMAVSGLTGPSTVVRADHPFAFAILHRPTGVPLFVGRVTNP